MTYPHSDDFFSELKEWSERKLVLLEAYLTGFVRILAQWRSITYVDGFAGCGTYGKEQAKGSPIRAAEYAQAIRDANKSYSLRCINVEKNPEYFKDLENATAAFGNLVLNLPGAFADNLDRILREIAGQPAIFFLDPFGVNDIDWVGVQALIARREPTDLWIRFDHKTVMRLTGFYPPQTPEAFKKLEILQRLYGVADVREILREIDAGSPNQRTENAIRFYLSRLAAEFRKARGAGFAAGYSLRALTGENKYYLLFATASPKAIVLASDVVYHREEQYQRELEDFRASRRLQPLLFSLDPSEAEIFEAKVKQVKDDVSSRCKGKKLKRSLIHALILEKYFGRISKRHLTAALKELEEEGTIVGRQGTIGEDNTILTIA